MFLTSSIIYLLILKIYAVDFLNTTSGIYVGKTVYYRDKAVQQYLGIQYGRIRTRFDHAEPVIRENNTFINATSFGSICKPSLGSCVLATYNRSLMTLCSANYGIFFMTAIPNEQCLFLNVFMPMNNGTDKKAIFMWIHGGSGQVGTGNVFDGTILAALGDIIVVTLNFRLNLFGFLSSGDQRFEGNLGLYDQAMALDWIYSNSEALGGDVQRITVGGHSAGAPHAYYLALSPFNRGRIRRLILQSGCPFNVWSHINAAEAMERFNTVVHDNECATMEKFDEKLKCLREKDYNQLGEHEHHTYSSSYHTNVVNSGYFMDGFQTELYANDTLLDTDILIGSNDDEGVYIALIPILIDQPHTDFIALDKVNFTEISLRFLTTMQPDKSCLYEKALDLYHINNIPDNCSKSIDCSCSLFYNYTRLIGDVIFYVDYYRFLKQRSQYSNKTFVYQYSYRTSQEHPTLCNEYFYKHNLVGHFAELEYTWGTPLLFDKQNGLKPLIHYIPFEQNHTDHYTDEQIQFSQLLIEQWSNFIKYGQPNSTMFKNQWTPILNDFDGLMMHFKMTESQLEHFEIPTSVRFWMNTCSSVEKSKLVYLKGRMSIEKISFRLFISATSLLIVRFHFERKHL